MQLRAGGPHCIAFPLPLPHLHSIACGPGTSSESGLICTGRCLVLISRPPIPPFRQEPMSASQAILPSRSQDTTISGNAATKSKSKGSASSPTNQTGTAPPAFATGGPARDLPMATATAAPPTQEPRASDFTRCTPLESSLVHCCAASAPVTTALTTNAMEKAMSTGDAYATSGRDNGGGEIGGEIGKPSCPGYYTGQLLSATNSSSVSATSSLQTLVMPSHSQPQQPRAPTGGTLPIVSMSTAQSMCESIGSTVGTNVAARPLPLPANSYQACMQAMAQGYE